MNKRLVSLVAVIVLFVLGASGAWGQNRVGTLEITGVPSDAATGRYHRETGVFAADVSETDGALIIMRIEDVQIVGKVMEWRTEDNYLIFTVSAQLVQDDFELTGDVIEYFSEDKKLRSAGNVVTITKDATVYADHLEYDETTDQAVFTGNVKVVFSDGVLEGEKFLMLLEKSELQFFGAFQGEFTEAAEQ